MTLTSDPVFPIPSVAVEAWPDPVVDELGHDPRSTYVERFWLPVLGPSTVWFLRRVADGLGAALGAALFVAVDVMLVQTVYYELTLFHARSPALGIPIWIYYAGVVLLSPFVFRGILRGALRRSEADAAAAARNREEGASS